MTNQERRRAAIAAGVFACALVAGPAAAATGRVDGQVTDPEGRPLAGVAVSSGAAAAVTGPGGLYALEGVSAAPRVVVTFAKEGYATTYGAVELPGSDDADDDGIPDSRDKCPLSDRRPTVTIDGCDTGLGNRMLHGCTAMDVFLDCAEDVSTHKGKPHSRCGRGKEWHLLGCLAEPRFLRRVDNLTWRTLKKAVLCVKKTRFPLEELEHRPQPESPVATLHRTLVPTGASRSVPAPFGATLAHRGSKVTVFPGSVPGTGNVDVAFTSPDTSGAELGTFPGDFRALERSQKEVLLETWGVVNVSVTQGGAPVSLASAAWVEILLPPGAPYGAGSRPALWFFDERDGLWREDPAASGVVQSSTTTSGRLAVFALVSRPGWWNVDSAAEVACLCGRVEDARGLPVEGALVSANGLSYPGAAFARSDENGGYCVEVPRGSRVALRASAVADGLRLDSPPAELVAPPAASACEDGGCASGPVLALPDVSCVCGRALDELGHPRAGVAVATSAGSAGVTDLNGGYCLGAPAEQEVTVFGEGYAPVRVTTPPPATCPNGCAVADLAPPPPTPAEACLAGRVFRLDGTTPNGSVSVEATEDPEGPPFASPVFPDADGRYTLSGVPAGRDVFVVVRGPDCDDQVPVNTGPGGPTCVAVPDIATGCGF
jgi:hypothetical protein